MNAASIENSERLQRVYSVLSDKRRYSTRDIIEKAHVCAVNSCVAELKAPVNGFDIKCEREGKNWYYQLV